MIRCMLAAIVALMALPMMAKDHDMMMSDADRQSASPGFEIISSEGVPTIVMDSSDEKGVARAINNFAADLKSVSGKTPEVSTEMKGKKAVIIGTLGSKHIKELVNKKKIDVSGLKGAIEKYLITFVDSPADGVDEAIVVVGSDRRGTMYGTYELSEQIGVSPWYWWADVPVEHLDALTLKKADYTNGEPAVRYRGLFLNDEAPCLTSWVENTFGTKYGGRDFYEKVFELILRLRGNYLWPAMWGWAFYADDPANSDLADEMGIIIGTSHHEPMARNHQEWARKRKEYGVWDYARNQKVIDQFFREGVRRVADKEDIITIGMRGDGDAPMGGDEGKDHEYVSRDEENLKLLRKIIKNQRNIIKQETGKSPDKHPQLWALYKEVQKYYDMGLRVPDDVIVLLADDNWGNVRKLPNAEELKHPGGYGLYYHVDYVGAPRNSKWLNVTPIQGMWEQLSLAAEYGVDKLWVLNVGDLKPMEYPITLFLDMAWNPTKYNASNLKNHTKEFCAQQFGEDQAAEAARILNLYSKYNGRVTPEMLDRRTYNLESGEWRDVRGDYLVLEAEALRQYAQLDPAYRDAYKQLILYPVQAMANLYDMYYSQAMNHHLYKMGNPECNAWADRVEKAFKHDKELGHDYNKVMAGGKWDGMMTQKHIGYRSWNDNFREDIMPAVYRIDDNGKQGGYTAFGSDGVVVIEAPHYSRAESGEGTEWTLIPDVGRTLGGVTLMPRTAPVGDADLCYDFVIPEKVDSVEVIVVVKSTLAFHDPKGHEYKVGINNGPMETVNFNYNLNEDPENVYTHYYPTVARRVVEKRVKLPLGKPENGKYTLTLKPLDPAIVFEKIVINYGGYKNSYLYMDESELKRGDIAKH